MKKIELKLKETIFLREKEKAATFLNSLSKIKLIQKDSYMGLLQCDFVSYLH